MTKKNANNNKRFENDTFIAIPTSLSKASHMQYVNKDGEQITVPVCSDFKILYGFLSDQCWGFGNQKGVDGEGQEFYQDWDMIFRIIGRKYTGDKNSLKLVKLLEDCGLLVQTKRPNSTSTIKTVFDVTTIKSISFSNPERDKWEQEQHQRREDRKKDYAEAKAEKLAAIAAAKQQHQQSVSPDPEQPAPPEQQPEPKKPEQPRQPQHQTQIVQQQKIKQVSDSNDDDFNAIAYCDDVSHDQQFENQYKIVKPKVTTQITKVHAKHEDGRLCSHCYKHPNGDWHCEDSYCDNYIPF